MAAMSHLTDQELRRLYEDNSDYALLNSPGKCDLFIQACMVLKLRIGAKGAAGEFATDFGKNLELLEAELQRALVWRAAHGAGRSHVTYASLQGYRR